MPKQIIRPRFAVWAITIMVLLLALLVSWHKIEREASGTALEVASKRILERANFYKQQWLLAKQPQQLVIGQNVIHYTATGWVKPVNADNNLDCEYWLALLYQERQVLGNLPNKTHENSTSSSFQCKYYFEDSGAITIDLIGGKFNVDAIFTAE